MKTCEELQVALENGDWSAAETVMSRLSCSAKRRMERDVRVIVLPKIEGEAFWRAWAWLVAYRPQAFLPSLTACGRMAQRGTLDFRSPAAQAAVAALTPEQAGKAASIAAPHLRTAAQMEQMIEAFAHAGRARIASALVRETTPLAYYGLFHLLRAEGGCSPHGGKPTSTMDEGRQLAYECCKALIRKGDDLSLNMASILRAEFALDELPAKLALRIEPYELSYVHASYDHFLYVLKGKQPGVARIFPARSQA